MKVPLAWHNLTHDKRRLLLAVMGVAFAVLLMFLQLGFRNALFDSTVAFIEALDADLVITAGRRYTLAMPEPFSRRRLEQAHGVDGVAAAEPLYVEQSQGQLFGGEPRQGRPIRLVGFDPEGAPFGDADVRAAAAALRRPFTALVDTRSKDHFGPLEIGSEVNVAGKTLRIVGSFALGTDFANDGTLLVSTRTLHELLPIRYPSADGEGDVDLGVVRLAPGADIDRVRRGLGAVLPDDVRVFTKAELAAQERAFWRRSTPIGFVFGLGLVLGFVVGTVVCYQVLATEIADHMAELATLKAMGYAPGYFIRLVVEESLVLATLAFLPALACAGAAYWWLGMATGLPMRLSADRIAMIFALTLAMCVTSGLLAIRKLQAAAPADLFT
jgi:putative ABC transport system permease protein